MEIQLIGLVLKGRYCVLEELGKGGDGCLYLARDLELGIQRAVKQIPIERKQEARLLRFLEHPSLPKMVDYLEKGEYCYLVMEYIRGKSLGELLRQGRSFSAEEVLEIGLSVCSVLQYFHMQRPPVYYGDLKPDNLMMTGDGHLYLIDLGSAVHGFGRILRVSRGTVGFAAPEQYRGEISAASDIYALGKTINVLLGRNKYRVLFCHPGLGLFLFRCCQKEQESRPKDIQTAVRALEKIKSGLSRGRRKVLLWILAWLGFFGVGYWAAFGNARPEFRKAFAGVTELYYQEDFINGGKNKKMEVSILAESRCRQLLREYPEMEAQRKLLLQLALNGELQGEYARAALYYEQLLLYDPAFADGYAEYGLFLCRRGQMAGSAELEKMYQEKVQEGEMEKTDDRNLNIWMEKIKEWKEGEKVYEQKEPS